MYGPKYENGEWKIRKNRELEEMSKGENMVKWIKEQRISWLGHLQRMEEDRMPKKIFTQGLEWTRRRGRPRKRWEEEVERDLQVMGARRWKEMVADRIKWKDIVRQSKAHSGLYYQLKKKLCVRSVQSEFTAIFMIFNLYCLYCICSRVN